MNAEERAKQIVADYFSLNASIGLVESQIAAAIRAAEAEARQQALEEAANEMRAPEAFGVTKGLWANGTLRNAIRSLKSRECLKRLEGK